MAKLANAPFIKVEATKFTEVGYVGRDVESIIRDLVDSAVRMVKAERIKAVEEKAMRAADERILDILVPRPGGKKQANPFGIMFGFGSTAQTETKPEPSEVTSEELNAERERYRKLLELSELENTIEIEVEDRPSAFRSFRWHGMEDVSSSLQDALGGLMPKRTRKRRTTSEEENFDSRRS